MAVLSVCRHPRRAPLAAAAVIVGLLAGCIGGDDPAPTSATSSAPSASTSASPPPRNSTTTSTADYVPTKPDFPAAAKKHTDAGAVAFVRYYLNVLDYAWSAPNPDILDGLATQDCELCAKLVQTATDSTKGGEKSTGPVLSVGKVFVVSSTPDLTHLACDLNLHPVSYLDRAGKVVYKETAKTLRWAAQVVWQDGWKVRAIGER
ncbi:MAG: DUF6318 family protein [Tetrasphaera sp.]